MDENTRLKLLAGLPIKVDSLLKIKPLTLRQIADMDYEQYNIYLSNLVADPKDFTFAKEIDVSKFSTWDIIADNMYHGGDEYREFILNCLKFILNEKVTFIYCKGCFYIGDIKWKIVLNKDNYESFKNVLNFQNCLDKNKDNMKTANSKAEEIKQKILKGRQLLQKKSGLEVTFEDLISVMAANGNGLNVLNVWELTLYQFNNQFSRMQMIEDYDINIRSLLAGAKKEDIQLKHYIRKIEN